MAFSFLVAGAGIIFALSAASEAAEEEKRAFPVGGKVKLAQGYARHSDALRGPLKPGKVGEIIKVQRGRVLVQASGKKWWYDKPAVERDGRYTRDFSKLVVGSKVKLARDYADFNDAPLGPLQPGQVGEIIKVDVTLLGRVLVEASGRRWWYDKPAVEIQDLLLLPGRAPLHGTAAMCNVAGCSRPTWNGLPGEQCCRTCKHSASAKHGPVCESNWKLACAPADPSAGGARKRKAADLSPYPGAPDRSRWHSKRQGLQKLFSVHEGSDEFSYVEALFKQTMRGVVIDSIERVENKSQHDAYSLQKKIVARELGPDFDEARMVQMLFHGTSAQSTQDIVHGVAAGYEPNAAGSSTGAIWGDGTYFARDASYSHRFAGLLPSGKRQMLVNEVLVGVSTIGKKGTKLYPKVPGAKNSSTRYHSLVDNVSDPTIFVVARSTAAYPAFLITYH